MGWEPYVSTTYATAELSNFITVQNTGTADEYFMKRMLYVPEFDQDQVTDKDPMKRPFLVVGISNSARKASRDTLLPH